VGQIRFVQYLLLSVLLLGATWGDAQRPIPDTALPDKPTSFWCSGVCNIDTYSGTIEGKPFTSTVHIQADRPVQIWQTNEWPKGQPK
jgi:hypothetical protein